MFNNILGKMQEEQQNVKEKLDKIILNSNFQNKQIQIEITGNKKIKNINISEEILQENNKEMLEEILAEAVNQALLEAESYSQKEMQKMLKDIMPNIHGLNL